MDLIVQPFLPYLKSGVEANGRFHPNLHPYYNTLGRGSLIEHSHKFEVYRCSDLREVKKKQDNNYNENTTDTG